MISKLAFSNVLLTVDNVWLSPEPFKILIFGLKFEGEAVFIICELLFNLGAGFSKPKKNITIAPKIIKKNKKGKFLFCLLF